MSTCQGAPTGGEFPTADGWPLMDGAAYLGLAGDMVRSLDPHTEADPVAVLLTLLASFGIASGPTPHALADGSAHPARLNVVLVGRSARARKGTSRAVVRRVLERADPLFVAERIMGGLASGEGLVAALANDDPDVVSGLEGSLLVQEPEFARLLRVAGRPGSTLSAVLREAWDGNELRGLTRSLFEGHDDALLESLDQHVRGLARESDVSCQAPVPG